jgi:transcriptional regulator with XRE-family HTH domain
MSQELQKLFGQNVRRYRKAQGMTQEELASKAGINRSYLGGVERGQRTICMDNIAKIAQALVVAPDVLFRPDAPLSRN